MNGEKTQVFKSEQGTGEARTRSHAFDRGIKGYTFSFLSSVRPLSDSSRQLDTQCSDTFGGHDFAPAWAMRKHVVRCWRSSTRVLNSIPRFATQTYVDTA
jgi:hypothetical protein